MIRNLKVIVLRHLDGYLAYPIGLRDVCVGLGTTYHGALEDLRETIHARVKASGMEVFDEQSVLEVSVTEMSFGMDA